MHSRANHLDSDDASAVLHRRYQQARRSRQPSLAQAPTATDLILPEVSDTGAIVPHATSTPAIKTPRRSGTFFNRRRSTTSPRTRQQELEKQQAIIQELPGLGTWAHRHRIFPIYMPPPAEPEPFVGSVSSISAEKEENDEDDIGLPPSQQDQNNLLLAPENGDTRPNGASTSFVLVNDSEETNSQQRTLRRTSSEGLEEAWRWRFARKWEAEHQRAPLTREDSFMSQDEEETLKYCTAVGMGVDLQLNPGQYSSNNRRNRSIKTPHATPITANGNGNYLNGVASADLQPSGSTTSLPMFDVDASYNSDLLLGSTCDGQSPAASQRTTPSVLSAAGTVHNGNAMPSATRHIMKVASRARDLLKKQAQVEADTKARLEESFAGAEVWAGALMGAVKIDMYGKFTYVILRCSDNSGRQRFLVRGRNRATQQQLLTEAQNELSDVCRRNGQCAMAMLEIVGEGRMEWRADTERHLHLSPVLIEDSNGRVGKNGGTSIGDVSRLTASLVQSVLPCHYKISAREDPDAAHVGLYGT